MATGMSKEQWQLTDGAAERYERYVARYILGPWAPSLVAAASVQSGAHVLDVACGTGVVARAAARRAGPHGRVVGLDLNPAMIAVARSLPHDGARIEWLQRSALALELPDGSFDAIVCQQGLQFFPDKLMALREMRRVLRGGGRVAASVWNSIGHYNGALASVMAALGLNELSARFSASRQVPPASDLTELANRAGLSNVQLRVERMDIHLPHIERFALHHLSATPVAAGVAALAPEIREAIGLRVKAELARFVDRDGVTYPEQTHVLTASAL
jgi:ubiquinone/menaquinone biosynthesis C-methylase UbiE